MDPISIPTQPHPKKTGRLMSQFRGLSTLLSRIALGQKQGTMYGGDRDFYTVFGYKRNPVADDFIFKYLHQDITRRIIDMPVRSTWSDPPTITGGDAFDTAWKTLCTDMQLYYHLSKVDTFAGLGQFAVLLVGLDDGRSLDKPVRRGDRKVIYLQPYLETSLEVSKFDEDPTSPRFGRPTEYKINPSDSDQKNLSGPARLQLRQPMVVHWERVIHVADNTLENTVFGHSRLEPVYNTLDDIMKTAGGSAETYWVTGNRGIQADVDRELELNEDDAEALADEIEEYQHGLRRFIRTRGVKVNPLGSDVADPTGVFEVQLSLLSAATGIPKRVLIGVEAGQLASQQDRANWAKVVDERIKNFAEPVVLRPTILRFTDMGILPTPKNLQIEWPDAFVLSPLESAQTSAQLARSMANVAKALDTARNGAGIPVFSVEEARQAVTFGKHMPLFKGKPTGTLPPEAEPEPAPTGAFGQPVAKVPVKK